MIVNAEFDISCFSDSNYIIEFDDMDDTGRIYWKEKDIVNKIDAEIPNHKYGWIGVQTVVGVGTNGNARLLLAFFASHPINADTIIVKTDTHRYTLDVREGRSETTSGYEQYLIAIDNNELLQLMQEIGTDSKPEKIRFSGEIIIDGKLKFENDQTDISLREGFKCFARDYELAKGLEQDFSSYENTPCEVISVEPWEWEDAIQEADETKTTESTETELSEEKPKRTKVYTDEATVKRVQEQLNALGYDCGTANGINNEKTQKAITDYQRDYDLIVSGSVNEEILQSLENRKIIEITEGTYKVGEDILAGEYIIFASGSSGYFCVSSDSNQDDILFNGNFDYNSIITVNDGEYLELERCYAVPFDEVGEIDLTGDGMFKVGTHIPAGEYKLESEINSGYYCVYSDSRQQDIIANDNFEGQNYVTVSDGEYLVLDRCTFVEIPQKTYSDAGTIQKVQQALNDLGYDCGTADGIKGEKTKDAIIKYQQDNGLTVSGEVNDSLLKALSIITNNNSLEVGEENGRTSNIITDETEWENWKSTGRCMLFPFMQASDLLDFSWGNPQKDGSHVWVECFEGNGDFGMYYCADNQRIMYVGLYTDNINVFSSEAFRNACVKLIRSYNIHFEDEEVVFNLQEERAGEIVDFALNNTEHCLADNMRIRVIKNEGYYSFHVEY